MCVFEANKTSFTANLFAENTPEHIFIAILLSKFVNSNYKNIAETETETKNCNRNWYGQSSFYINLSLENV